MDTTKLNEEKIKSLNRHIDALQTSYDNMISILSQDVEKDDNDNIKLKDTQKRLFAQGTMEVAQAAQKLLEMIDTQKIKLESLQKGIDLDLHNSEDKDDEGDTSNNTESLNDKKNGEEYPLEKHLN